jgi:hypothetical protein
MADRLLRHEKQFFSRLLTDLIDTVKQRSGENKLEHLNAQNIKLQTIFYRLLTDLIDTVKQRSGENKLDHLNTQNNSFYNNLMLSSTCFFPECRD